VILAEDLTKRFGETTAVADVSFRVDPGEIFCIVGSGGAGRTTTLRMLVGLVRPTLGRALVLDRPYAELTDPAKRVGVLLGDGLHPRRGAREHLRIGASAAGLSPRHVHEAIDLTGLGDCADVPAARLNPGTRQRLRLALALLARPDVLVLDEPDQDLDRGATDWLEAVLDGLAGDGCAVLCTYGARSRLIDRADGMLVLDRGTPADGGQRRHHAEVDAEPAADDDEDELEELESSVADELRERTLGPGRVLTVARAGPGRGSTTVSLLVADALSDRTGCSALVLALSSDGETLRGLAADEQRSPLRLGDLLEDLPDFDDRAQIDPYVSRVSPGADALAGWSATDASGELGPRQVQDVIAFAKRFYDVVVIDVGDAPALALSAALRACDDAVLVDTSDAVEESGDREVLAAIEREAPAPAILVLNQMDWEPGRVYASRRPRGRHGVLPADPELQRMLAEGDLDRSRLARTTRIALDRLAIVVADALA
jgi:ABC-type multidrug transport system ATPase subunit